MNDGAIAGEARLDNRDELHRALGVEPEDRRHLSDLGLILRAYDRWGEACPGRILGDFAFIIRDHRADRSFGARDHLGVKPFYYRVSEQGLAFATRASSIAAADGRPLELNEARIADALVPALECVDATSTFYRGVLRLPPGHLLRFESGRTSVASYWTLDPSHETRLNGDAEFVEAFRDVFTEAVRCRLSGSVASMLSGGLDSSTIVGFARAILKTSGRPPLTTLSAVTDDPRCEESKHIRAVLELPGLEPIALRPEDVGAYRDEIAAFLETMEEPFDDSMMIPLIVYAAAKRRGIGAVLDGVDGDVVASHEPDILAGFLAAGRWGRAVREAKGFARFYGDSYAPWSSAAGLLAVNAARTFVPGWLRAGARPLRQARGISNALAASCIHRDFAARLDVPERLRSLWAQREVGFAVDPRERQARELTHPQIGAALERYHRVAASQGIEARHPFFDKRLVEFCLALPCDQKVAGGWSKLIVRRAAAGILPDEVRWRRGRWVRLGSRFLDAVIAGSGGFLDGELAGSVTELAPYVDLAKLRRLHDRHRRGDLGAGPQVWSAAVLAFWLRKTRCKRYDSVDRANGPGSVTRLSFAG